MSEKNGNAEDKAVALHGDERTLTARYGAPEVPLELIRENPAALRPLDGEAVSYLELVESVKRNGVLQPVQVVEMKDPDNGNNFFRLVNGLHRWSAAKDAGLKTIPVNVVDADGLEILRKQIITNHTYIDTKPIEYTKGIQRLMSADPTMTKAKLASQLTCSVGFIDERLGLLNLSDDIQPLVESGQIPLTNAYALSKLRDFDEQKAFKDRAMTMPGGEFSPLVQARVKEIQKARREGRAANPPGFQPHPKMKSLKDIQNELQENAVGKFLHQELHPKSSASAFALGFKTALEWAVSMDELSIKQQEARYEQDKAKRDQDKKAREKERAEKKSKELTEKLQNEQAKLKELETAQA